MDKFNQIIGVKTVNFDQYIDYFQQNFIGVFYAGFYQLKRTNTDNVILLTKNYYRRRRYVVYYVDLNQTISYHDIFKIYSKFNSIDELRKFIATNCTMSYG